MKCEGIYLNDRSRLAKWDCLKSGGFYVMSAKIVASIMMVINAIFISTLVDNCSVKIKL